jgi:hypothetical protein
VGCDVGYKCESAERESVERLVAVIKRWAEVYKLPYKLVDLKNCTLGKPWTVPKEPNYEELKNECKVLKALKWVFEGRRKGQEKPTEVTEEEIRERQSDIRRKIEYLRSCRQGVDLYGVFIEFISWEEKVLRIPVIEDGTYKFENHSINNETIQSKAENYSRGQFIFDIRNSGKLVRFATEPEYYQASNIEVPCYYYGVKGYWRSVGNYAALPRFLALCKIRYLPKLEAWSDYGEYEDYLKLFYENKEQQKKIASMNDDEFYEECVRPYTIIW